MKRDFNKALFKEKYPYIFWGNGSKKAIILPPTAELRASIKYTAPQQYFVFKSFFPADYKVYYFGYEPNLPETHSVDSLVSDIAEFIKLELGSATVIGISYGGLLAIPLTIRYPELVDRLVMMITAHKISNSGILFMKKAIDFAQKGDIKRLDAMFNRLYRRKRWEYLMSILSWLTKKSYSKIQNPLSTLINAYKEIIIRNGDYDTELQKIECPVLIIGGTADIFFSESIFRELASSVKNGTLKLFEEEHHMLPVEQAGKVKEIVLPFLAENRRFY
jgi:pimeloyl-ACP methyl ester carboxylesterase